MIKRIHILGSLTIFYGFLVSGSVVQGQLSLESPIIPQNIMDEVQALLPLATKYSQFDFKRPEDVDATFKAQQRLRSLGETVEWALLRLYEKSNDQRLKREVLFRHMRSKHGAGQTEYGLALTRKTIRQALTGDGNVSVSDAADAADYISFWGSEIDIELLTQIANTQTILERDTSKRFDSPLSRLTMRVSLGLPPGETDKITFPRKSFHQLGLDASSVESLKRIVAHVSAAQAESKKETTTQEFISTASDKSTANTYQLTKKSSAPVITDAKPSAPSGEPTSSTPWSIIVVLIVAAGGLLWLRLKRRS